MTTILRAFYSLFLYALLPLIFFRLWWRGRKLKPYRDRWAERVGIAPFAPLKHSLWVHAVSVGESISAVPLIRRFQASFPGTPIVITTMTPTGSQRVRDAFKEELGVSIYNVYVPYDLGAFVKRLINHIKPKMFVAMETEIWPNLLNELDKAKVPVLIANGRLSPHSFKWYKRLGRVMKQILSPVSHVAAQSAMDAERFKGIGMNQQKVTNIGNIKFDFELPANCVQQGKQIHELLSGTVLIAASTHEGEEKVILEVYKALKAKHNVSLILVPRHPDRFEEVAKLCELTSFKVKRRSQGLPDSSTEIYLGDTMGEMMMFYASSDIAFVGGSLVPIGGHNLLEPAALSLPVVTGHHLFNFTKISSLMKDAQAVKVVNNKTELEHTLDALLASAKECSQMGIKAKSVVDQNRGALDKLFEIMAQLWQKPSPRLPI